MSGFHRDIKGDQNHVLHFREYADKDAREAATGLDASHLHKVALQMDECTYWVLAGLTPLKWEPVGDKQELNRISSALATVEELISGGLGVSVTKRLFTSSSTWNKPNDLVFLIVMGAGGGGGGGSGLDGGRGGDGGSGGAGIMIYTADELESTVTVTVGAKAASQSSKDCGGRTGGTSQFHTAIFRGGGGGAWKRYSGTGSHGQGGISNTPGANASSVGRGYWSMLGGQGGVGTTGRYATAGTSSGSVLLLEVCNA